MTDRIFALRVFAQVARTGSFSKAARELALSQPSVSRIVAALEAEIGVALMTRTTRGLRLTDAGSDYLARIEPILDALEEADHAARGTGELRGVLRVALSSGFAAREVIPRLAGFMARHPALRIELLMSDQRQDLVGERIDVALRFGALTDSNATARLIGVSPRIVVAAPSYLRRAGTPRSPEQLAGHAMIVGPSRTGQPWTFERDGRSHSVRVEGRLKITTHEAAIAAAVAGLGIVSTALWGCREELAAGTLVALLPDWHTGSVEVHALFPAGRAAKPAARAFADHVIGGMRPA
ncbi:MAG TPA: LysR family transcriptional regulator [Dokdonella sp.]|nr:LysR family transcriptional regulator [Dokdonella sp.]